MNRKKYWLKRLGERIMFLKSIGIIVTVDYDQLLIDNNYLSYLLNHTKQLVDYCSYYFEKEVGKC